MGGHLLVIIWQQVETRVIECVPGSNWISIVAENLGADLVVHNFFNSEGILLFFDHRLKTSFHCFCLPEEHRKSHFVLYILALFIDQSLEYG